MASGCWSRRACQLVCVAIIFSMLSASASAAVDNAGVAGQDYELASSAADTTLMGMHHQRRRLATKSSSVWIALGLMSTAGSNAKARNGTVGRERRARIRIDQRLAAEHGTAGVMGGGGVAIRFLVASHNPELLAEAAQYGDVLLLNFNESMYRCSLKVTQLPCAPHGMEKVSDSLDRLRSQLRDCFFASRFRGRITRLKGAACAQHAAHIACVART